MSFNKEAMFSSANKDWETPKEVYKELDEEFSFTLDPCAKKNTAKCKRYFTKEDNGLTKDWKDETVFVNPPYGRDISKWIQKCYYESSNATVVALLPSRTDTTWFHSWILNIANEIRFIRGRLRFSGYKNSAPFPSMIVIWRKRSWAEKEAKKR